MKSNHKSPCLGPSREAEQHAVHLWLMQGTQGNDASLVQAEILRINNDGLALIFLDD